MTTIILTIHILLAIALVAVVLVQRSEGGGLGIGGSGQGGGLMTAKSTANALTRLTAMLATAFFCTSIALAILAGNTGTPRSVADEINQGGDSIPQIRTEPAIPSDQ